MSGQFVSGWIELKHLDEWPVRVDTTVRFRELTLEQVLWSENWPGNAWLLARVRRDYMLFSKREIRRVYEGLTSVELLGHAAMLGGPRFPTGKLLDALTLADNP
jgi:hypothetical protein